LFLDEVGELPLNIQKAFLRVLQERRFRPLGSHKEITSDFRLVVATNRNLSQMVAEGRFRDDLLFRLRSFVIELPPLRDRIGDIKELAMHHLAGVCERLKIGLKGLAPEFMEALNSYRWPGNVRELMHAMERAVASALYEHTLHVKHLPAEIRISLARDSLSKKGDTAGSNGQPPKCAEIPLKFKDYRKAMDRRYFLDLMVCANGNVRRACELSGLSRSRFYS
ncbi:MAG TPA: Fis family transcriptional regulator, partial [Syntrophobacteraceae bacterium]|nr:Fis family transcriptional regulator [Syntrophobacteraceae bacterium]